MVGNACFRTLLSLSIFTFPVPVIDPVSTERFPEYVRDMLYGEENKLKTEFLVRAPLWSSFYFSKDIVPCTNIANVWLFMFYPRGMWCDDSHMLCLHTQALAKLPQPPSTVAVLPHNKPHNRFNNIYPCEPLSLSLNITKIMFFLR